MESGLSSPLKGVFDLLLDELHEKLGDGKADEDTAWRFSVVMTFILVLNPIITLLGDLGELCLGCKSRVAGRKGLG